MSSSRTPQPEGQSSQPSAGSSTARPWGPGNWKHPDELQNLPSKNWNRYKLMYETVGLIESIHSRLPTFAGHASFQPGEWEHIPKYYIAHRTVEMPQKTTVKEIRHLYHDDKKHMLAEIELDTVLAAHSPGHVAPIGSIATRGRGRARSGRTSSSTSEDYQGRNPGEVITNWDIWSKEELEELDGIFQKHFGQRQQRS